MIALFRLLAQVAASFAGGYIVNDVVDIFQSRQAQRRAGQPPTGMFVQALNRWREQAFLMKFLFVVALATVVSIVFMTRVARKKLFR